MTATTNLQVGNEWVVIADSAVGDSVCSWQNYQLFRLEFAISPDDLADDLRGLYTDGGKREDFAGFEGKVRVRYPSAKAGETFPIGVIVT